MAILKPKTADKTRTFSARIPADLYTEIEAIRNEAEQRGFVFDVQEIVNKSLSVAVKQARAELQNA